MLAVIEYETFDAVTDDPIDKKIKLLIDTEKNTLPREVNEMIERLKPNETQEVTVRKPFGNRDKDLLRIVPEKTFRNNNVKPVPGMIVSLDGKQAIIRSVSSSRVIVDLNHPLAGKDIKYRIKLLENASDPIDKAQLFLKFHGIKAEVKHEGDKIIIIPLDKNHLDKINKLLNLLKNVINKEIIVNKGK